MIVVNDSFKSRELDSICAFILDWTTISEVSLEFLRRMKDEINRKLLKTPLN